MSLSADEAAVRTDDGRLSRVYSDEHSLCSLGRTGGLDMAEQEKSSQSLFGVHRIDALGSHLGKRERIVGRFTECKSCSRIE